jgi:cysteine-rich repeat protein
MQIIVAIIALFSVFFGTVEVRAMPAPDASSVLILETTVTGCPTSLEATKAAALGYTPVCVDAATWGAMPGSDFGTYRALILGDPTCLVVGTSPVDPADLNKAVWGPEVDGTVVLVGTDPVYHSSFGPGGPQGGDAVTEKGIAVAASDPAKTGLYATLSCYYHDTLSFTPVPFLSTLGAFTVTGVGCYNDSHIVAVHPALAGLTDANLSNWSCSVHEAFDSFPSDFLPLAIAEGIGGSGSLTFPDGSFGVPYILARGEAVSPILCGNGLLETGEECDDGNVTNGDGCSAQCKIEIPTSFCGDGIFDAGEECDDGNNTNGDGCSADCKIENKPPNCSTAMADPDMLWPPNHQMVNVMVIGVEDPDGDPVVTTVVDVWQDEPLDGLGDGDTAPDAMLNTDGSVDLRAERAGTKKVPGDGRVYHVRFVADDGVGGLCKGEVTVCVPHDQGNGSVCVDGGLLYNSLGL